VSTVLERSVTAVGVATFAPANAPPGKWIPKREMKKRLGELLAVSEWRAVVETVRHVSGDDESVSCQKVRLLEGIDELSERVVLTGESRFVDGPKRVRSFSLNRNFECRARARAMSSPARRASIGPEYSRVVASLSR